MKKALPSWMAVLGAAIVFAGQTGPDQAFANIGGWLNSVGLGHATRWVRDSGLAGWATGGGISLLAAAGLLGWRRRKARQLEPAQSAPSPPPPPVVPVPAAAPGPSPLLTQIDSLIDRLERSNQAYASDPDGFFKLPKYSRLRVQVKELDDLTTAVKLAVRRKYGAGSEEDLHAASAIRGDGDWRAPDDDDYFRSYIDWMVRLRGVATLLGH